MNMLDDIKKEILWHMPKKMAHQLCYERDMKKKLNLAPPKDFNEKIQWLMLNEYDERYGKLADKYLVRNYVGKIRPDILTKLYGVYDNALDIDFDKLPQKFVLKTNHGSGKVYICTDKKIFNVQTCVNDLNKQLKENFAKVSLEYHYKYIKPKIICEEYLDDGKNLNPIDYKFYCFNGNAECVLVCSNRDKKLKLDYYDLDWNYLNYSKDEYKSGVKFEKPKKLKEMIKIAEQLSKEFVFVRVDLYEINGKIYFGELTFTPAAGRIYYNTQSSLNYLGGLIDLSKIK